MAQLTKEQHREALKIFDEYFAKNYPGPNTIIGDPHWHAPKILRAAEHAIETALLTVPKPAGESGGRNDR